MSFQTNVKESFRRAKEDMVRIETTMQHLIKEQEELNKKISKLAEKQIMTDAKLKVLSKK